MTDEATTKRSRMSTGGTSQPATHSGRTYATAAAVDIRSWSTDEKLDFLIEQVCVTQSLTTQTHQVTGRLDNAYKAIDQIQNYIHSMHDRISNVELRVLDSEARSRRSNLVFYNISEPDSETVVECEATLRSFLIKMSKSMKLLLPISCSNGCIDWGESATVLHPMDMPGDPDPLLLALETMEPENSLWTMRKSWKAQVIPSSKITLQRLKQHEVSFGTTCVTRKLKTKELPSLIQLNLSSMAGLSETCYPGGISGPLVPPTEIHAVTMIGRSRTVVPQLIFRWLIWSLCQNSVRVPPCHPQHLWWPYPSHLLLLPKHWYAIKL